MLGSVEKIGKKESINDTSAVNEPVVPNVQVPVFGSPVPFLMIQIVPLVVPVIFAT